MNENTLHYFYYCEYFFCGNHPQKEVLFMDKITISECAESLIDVMRAKHYSESTIRSYKNCFNSFLKYSKKRGKDYFEEVTAIEYANSVTGLELNDLLLNYKDIKRKYYITILRSLCILGEYSRTRTFVPRLNKFHDPLEDNEYWSTLYKTYIFYLKTDCDYKDSTLNRKGGIIRKMFNILIELKIKTLDEITPNIIDIVVADFIHKTPKSIAHCLTNLKQFFQHCYDRSSSTENICSYLPKIKVAHETKIIVMLTAEETKKLLDSIDRNDPKGKRDYAILMLASHLGLRAVDIINIKFSNMNWQCKTIIIPQEKTNHTITLPLLNDVGWSIIDYIKNGRPNVDNEYLFIKHMPPYDQLTHSSLLTAMFKKRLHDAGIKIKRENKCGIHSLRRTLASALLEKETPLPVISQILGHLSIQSTEVYLKINMKELRACPIDPERVFNDEEV